MAANKIKVNTISLDRTRRELQEKLEKIKKDIDQISENMSTLNSMWSGEAHSTFEQSVTEDIQFLQGVCENIQEIIDYESNAVKMYNKCEQQVSELIEQIRI